MAKIALPSFKKETKRSSGVSSEDQQQQIEKLAYQFFVERGYQHGFDAEDWARAEQAILGKKK